MTRENLIKAINDNEDGWSCPEYQCNAPEEEHNTGDCCVYCAERQLEEYENKIRADVYDDLIGRFCALNNGFSSCRTSDLVEMLKMIKEQTNG